MAKTIAIHQPNFFPHLAFFEKMAQSDVFVVMGHCQFEKNGYQNRFFYLDRWYTMPTEKGLRPICEKQYVKPQTAFEVLAKRLPKLEQFKDCITTSLFKTNFQIIEQVANFRQIKTQLVFDYPIDLTGTERLVDLCTHYEADTYLSGPSGLKYLDMEQFHRAGIDVIFQETSESKPIIDLL